MAWNWVIERIDFDTGNQVGVGVRIWKDNWTGKDKSMVRSWVFNDAASLTLATIASKVQVETTNYNTLKQAVNALEPSIGVDQVLA